MVSPHSRLFSPVTTKVGLGLLVEFYIFANYIRSCDPYPSLIPHECYCLSQQYHLRHEQYHSYRSTLLGYSPSRRC
jgi:hypothetical protein